MRLIIKVLSAALIVLSVSAPALAGDAVTIIFSSGQVVRIDDGYRQVMEAMKTIDRTRDEHRIVELNLQGGSALLDIAKVAIVCRDRCDNLTILHQLDPQRANRR